MPHRVSIHRPGAAPEPRALHGACTVGGSRSDHLTLPGLAPAALHLEPCAAGVVVRAAIAGARVAGHAVEPGGRRLLRPGERATVLEFALELEDEPRTHADGTRAAAADLLRDGAAAGARGPHLLVLTGPAAGERLPLGPEQTLGRSRRAGIRLADPQASRLHARVRLGPTEATVEDLGAKNGLFLDGARLERGIILPLRPGDELRLGETTLALVVPGAPAPAPGSSGPAEAEAAARASPRHPHPARRATAALLLLSALAFALAGS